MNELSINEQYVWISLLSKTFSTGNWTNILPSTLAAQLNLSEKTINTCIESLITMGWLQRKGTGLLVIIPIQYEYFDPQLFNVVNKNAGILAVRLAKYRVGKTPNIQLTDSEILKTIGISKPIFSAAKKELIANGILIKVKKGYIMDTTFFPLVSPTVSEAFRSRAAVLLQIADQEGYNSASRVFKYYYDKGFEGLRMSPDDLVEYCEIGCPGINHNKMTDTYDFPEEYQF